MTVKDRQTIYWIWLAQACGGTILSDHLLDVFGDAESIYRATAEEYDALSGISPARMARLNDKDLTAAEQIEKDCEAKDIGIVTAADPRYPERLKRIKERPPVLYFRGSWPAFDRILCVAMVGTRRMTEYGARMAGRFGSGLGREGVLVVSGMADGIDGAAHRSTLYCGGYTVAVLGCGCDVVYPKKHALLMEEIVRNGAVISEYSPGTEPEPKNFPRRNRIISGLCQATVVVEADKRSGSLITARCAARQGRRVFSVPGNVGEWSSSGTNQLIREGVQSVSSAEDLLRDLRWEAKGLEKLPRRAYSPVWDHGSPDGVNAGGDDDFELTSDRSADFPTDCAQEASLEKGANARTVSTVRADSTARTAPVAGRRGAEDLKKQKNSGTSAASRSAAESGTAESESTCQKRSSDIDSSIPIDAFGQTLLAAFPADGAPVSPDFLESRLRAAGEKNAVLPTLTVLEIAGYIEAAPGGTYRLIANQS